MKIAIACDHGGFPLKEVVLQTVRESGHEALDLGVFGSESVDFPDYVEKAGVVIQQNQADRAILICGSGVGACIAANKMKGIYAGVCHDTYSAHQGVEHDNMNVLCLGGRIIGVEIAKEIIRAFLGATYYNEGRYQRRFNKILAIEEKG